MKDQPVSGKERLARRLVMPIVERCRKQSFRERKSVIFPQQDSSEFHSSDILTSWLCSETVVTNECISNVPIMDTTNEQKNLLPGHWTMEENQDAKIVLPSIPSDTSCLSPVTTPLRSSPSSLAYAGAKFNESPSPKVLPKPPSHWVRSPNIVDCEKIESVLKGILQVQC